ncbi:hypothetical protein V8F20_009976 [Naviculisporaceae sp. PSN 640]
MVSLKAFTVSLLVGAASAQVWWPPVRPTPTTQVAPNPVPAAPQATQSLYGRCGGEGHTGPWTCPQGAFCKPSNQWYSQCVSIENIQGRPGEVRTLTTVFSYDVGGQNPRQISTRVTYTVPTPGANQPPPNTARPTTSTTAPVQVVTLTLTPDEPCDHEYWCQKKK